MRERVLAIVSIIAQYVMEERQFMTESEIVEELLSEGFAAEEIDAAFSWMENISLAGSPRPRNELSHSSCRIFTPEENRAMSLEARGFLFRLRTMGILDDELLEEVIDRSLQTAEDEVTLKEVKAISALTLFTRSQEDWRREVDCFLEDDWSRLYH